MLDAKQFFAHMEDYPDFNGDAAVQNLATLLTFKTVSRSDASLMDKTQFQGAIEFLKTAFPICFEKMEVTIVNEMSLLMKLSGNDPEGVLFMAHMDVVPVNDGTEEDWDYPPFSGTVADGFIHGRGASDTKNSIIAALSSLEYLLGKGFVPNRDIYFAFGHDEETLGGRGNDVIGQMLKEQGVRLLFVFDEGGNFATADMFGQPDLLLGRVSIFEKGFTNINVVGKSEGGHSSKPGFGTSLGRVCKAMGKIEDNQFKPELNEVLRCFIDAIAPHLTQEPFKTWFQNPDQYEKEIIEFYSTDAKLDPIVRTTTAVNMLNGSPAANVLPQTVTGLINFRNAPGVSCQDVLNHCIEIANDPELEITLERGAEPSAIAVVESVGFAALKEAVNYFVPSAVMVPDLSVGGTDAKFYEDVCDVCLRFKPYLELPNSECNIHRTNERTLVDAHVMACKVYIYMMEHFC